MLITVLATVIAMNSPGQRFFSEHAGFILRPRSGFRAVAGTAGLVVAALPLALADLLPPVQAAIGYGAGLLGTLLVGPQISFALDWFKTRSVEVKPTHVATELIAYSDAPLGSGARLVRSAIHQFKQGSPMVVALSVRKVGDDTERLATLYKRFGFVESRERLLTLSIGAGR